MHYSIASCVLLGCVAALPHDGRLDKRQNAGSSASSPLSSLFSGASDALPSMLSSLTTYFMKTNKLLKAQNMEPKLRKEAKRMVLTWGPYELAPPAVGGISIPFFDKGTTMWNTLLEGLPKDATYLWANSSLVFEDGSDATIDNGIYLHHYGVYDIDKPGKQLTICPGLTPPRPSLFTGGAEDKGDSFYTTPDGSFNSGYYIAKDDKILSVAQVVNYANKTQKVFAKLEVEYVPGKVKDALEVGIQSMSVTGCGLNLAIMPKKDAKDAHMTSPNFPVLHDGYIVGSKGHLHDGGTNLVIKVNDKVMCDSRAVYGGASSTATRQDGQTWQTINRMTQCITPIPVKKGDNFTIEANYDYVKHPSRQHNGGLGEAEQMGIAFMAFGWKPE